MSEITQYDNGRLRRIADEDVPATVIDLSCGGRKLAAVVHPLGDDHPNRRATCGRLSRRGYLIVPAPLTGTTAINAGAATQPH